MTTNTSHPDQMALWTRHTLTGVIGNWRGPRALWGKDAEAATTGRTDVKPAQADTPKGKTNTGRNATKPASRTRTARPSTGRQTSSHVKTQPDTTSKNQQVRAGTGSDTPRSPAPRRNLKQ